MRWSKQRPALCKIALVVSVFLTVCLGMTIEEKGHMRMEVKDMFYHAYDNYMNHAFPHDELKPLTGTWTDSLGELGNLDMTGLSATYNGTAMSLVESLSTLAIMGNHSEFARASKLVEGVVNFDVDLRVNVFECTIRLLGGLTSAHLIATAQGTDFYPGYSGRLFELAVDLANRLLPAFETPTGLPYAWINLRTGVLGGETTEQCTAGCGTLILEFGLISRITGDGRYEAAARRALDALWARRSRRGLFGNTIDIQSGRWLQASAGIGPGVDSFYEYLLKAYVLFGDEDYWLMFSEAYRSLQANNKRGPWYIDTDMHSGNPLHFTFSSLSTFWPAVQVLAGDVEAAMETYDAFVSIWKTFGVIPEMYLLNSGEVHPHGKYYPLRPELMESTFVLYHATRDDKYLRLGQDMVASLKNWTRAEYGHAAVKDVTTGELEDHQPSYFLSETCKYLYLLFADDSHYLLGSNTVFTTEGHIVNLPMGVNSSIKSLKKRSLPGPKPHLMCANPWIKKTSRATHGDAPPEVKRKQGVKACHVEDKNEGHRCSNDAHCGVCGFTCKHRVCSPYGFCTTPS